MKDKKVLGNNLSFNLRSVSRFLKEDVNKDYFIPSIDVTHYIKDNNNYNNYEEIVLNANY